LNASCQDLVGAVGGVVLVDSRTKFLVGARRVPVGGAEEVNTVEYAEDIGEGLWGVNRPDQPAVGIQLAAKIAPRAQCAAVPQGVPDEDDGLAMPAKEVWILGIVRDQVT